MFEAATEMPAFMGCPAHMPAKLPGGFDGTEPAKTVSEEAQAKIEQCVIRQRQMLTKIADIALAAEAKSSNADVKLGSKYLENSRALCAIRELVGPGLTLAADLEKELSGEAESLPLQKEHKFGLLRNGVQMIRYASGPTVQLIGKRDRGPHERQDGKTGKVIYKVVLSRESKSAEVIVDGVSKMTIVGSHNNLLEHAGVAMLNCIIAFNAKRRRHEHAKAKRKAAKAKQQAHDSKQEGK